MQIEIQKVPVPKLAVVHDGEPLYFITKTWNNVLKQDTQNVFGYINSFWEKQTDAWQSEVFELYRQAHDIIPGVDDIDDMTKQLASVCVKIIDMHCPSAMHTHIRTLPDEHKPYIDATCHNAANSQYPPEQTYDVEDYLQLVELSTILKSMTPVWGTFNAAVSPSIYESKMKELYAFELIAKSAIMESRAMRKVWDFANAWIANAARQSLAAITMGLPSEKLPEYFTALICVRRLPVHTFRIIDGAKEPNATISTQNALQQMYNFTDSEKATVLKGPKVKETPANAEDDKDSILEQQRIAEEVARDRIETAAVYVENYKQFTKDAIADCTDEDIQRVETYMAQMNSYERFTLSDFHLPFIGATVYDCVSYKFLTTFKHDTVVPMVAVAAAKMHSLGFPDLATLMVAERKDIDLDDVTIGGIPMHPLVRETRVALDEMYKYSPRKRGVKLTLNPGIEFIQETVKIINRHVWNFPSAELINFRVSTAKLFLEHLSK